MIIRARVKEISMTPTNKPVEHVERQSLMRKLIDNLDKLGRTHPFLLALLSFVTALVVARTFTFYFPLVQIRLAEFHIHHYYFGVIGLIIAGGIPAYTQNLKQLPVVSMLYGGGSGLIINQIGEMFTGDYWSSITWYFAIAFALLLVSAAILNHWKPPYVPQILEQASIVQTTSRWLEKISYPPYLLVLASFVVSFILARVYVFIFPSSQFWVSNIHIHHYNLGIVFLLLSIAWLLTFKRYVYEKLFLISYGTGIGIFMDEIGLQLDPMEDYLSPITYIYTAIFLGIITILLVSQYFSYKKRDQS
ncbi:MAG: hypothetical protein ACXACA_01115 [Candidatus Ranarchaeia archaeon]|jgi:hypothetical protein